MACFQRKEFQTLLNNIDVELINEAYSEAIERIDLQRKLLNGLYVKEFISLDSEYNISTSSNIPTDSEIEELAEKFKSLSVLLEINSRNIFFVKVEGDSMENANINSGDIVVVNKSSKVQNNSIIIVKIFDNYYVKRYKCIDNEHWLFPENDLYSPVHITSNIDFRILGNVCNVIKKVG